MAIGEWLLGYAGAKIGDRLLKVLSRDELLRQLETAVDDWRQKLPDNARLDVAAALFPSIKIQAELQARPALNALRQEMAAARVPGQETWTDALIEQWRQVKATIKSPQLFFTLGEDDARTYLKILSARLVDTCAQQERLFRPTVLALLLDFQAQIEVLTAKAPIEAAADGLPLTALAIEWTDRMSQIRPRYHHAMDAGLPWPGAHTALLDDEFRHYRMLKSLLAEIAPTDCEAVAAMDALRMRPHIDALWHHGRESLIDKITRLEGTMRRRPG